MDWFGILLVGQRVNGYLVGNHKRGIEAKSEMTDNLVLIGFVLVLLHEILDAGKCNLVNILVNLVLGHAKSIVCDLYGLVIWIHGHLDFVLQILRSLVLAHELQFLKLGNGIAAIAYQLPVENVMVRVQPFLDYWENVLACN